MDLNLHVYFHDGCDLLRRLDAIVHQIAALEKRVMATLDDVVAKVAAESTVIDSAVTLLNELSAKVAALQPNQAAIDALAADIQAKSDALAAAVTANTPTP